jgi:DNA ligase-1
MAQFLAVAELAEEMAGTSSRLKKRAGIAVAIATVHAEGKGDEGIFCLYMAGLPFAESDPRKLNAGGALLTKAVLAVTGASQGQLSLAYRRHGDLGAAVFDLMSEKPRFESPDPGHPVLLREVEAVFGGMATAKTTAMRAGLVEGLLRAASPLEAKYLLKLMLGDMRIGVKQSLVEEAIAVAAGVDVAEVRHCVMLEADLGDAAMRAFGGTLAEARMRLFHPLGFMLASPVETPEEAIERFTAKPAKVVAKKKPKKRGKGAELDEVMEEAMANDVEASMLEADALEAAVLEAGAIEAGTNEVGGVQAFLEDKYDGMRAQVHCGSAEHPRRVSIYSRNREDITESFPELVEAFAEVGDAGGGGLIFDGEILGWDFGLAQALPFAVLGQRIGRKKVENEWRQRVPVIFMAFDLMFADGALQLPRPLRDRRNRLEAAVEALVDRVRSPLVLSEAAKRKTVAQATLLFDEPVHRDEAAMNGADDGSTAPLRRLMISPARLVESAEEIDRAYVDARARANEGVMLKAVGSVYQPGRRGLAWVKLKRELATLDVVITGAEYGSGRRAQFLSDYTFAVRDSDGELKNVGKAYSGVTDAEIAELTEFLKAHTLEDFGHFRTVEPLVVLEVAFNNVMRSDRHASGFALRFPRILRVRTDKPLAEIDTVARVEEVYQSQVDKPAEAEQSRA